MIRIRMPAIREIKGDNEMPAVKADNGITIGQSPRWMVYSSYVPSFRLVTTGVQVLSIKQSPTRAAVPPSSAFWILASRSCRIRDSCARTSSLLPVAWLQVIVEVPQAELFLLPADFPNAWFCHLPDPSPAGPRVAQSVSVHSIGLFYARQGIDFGRLAAPSKEIVLPRASDFLILPNLQGSV